MMARPAQGWKLALVLALLAQPALAAEPERPTLDQLREAAVHRLAEARQALPAWDDAVRALEEHIEAHPEVSETAWKLAGAAREARQDPDERRGAALEAYRELAREANRRRLVTPHVTAVASAYKDLETAFRAIDRRLDAAEKKLIVPPQPPSPDAEP